MVTILFVNGGNYLYNLLLGRILGPAEFSMQLLITFFVDFVICRNDFPDRISQICRFDEIKLSILQG
jgi:hypothetical protein